jgi:lipopolysaccharide assembly outer membrane protein LptD (OstA)
MDSKTTILTGNARVAYQDMKLNAARITVDWERRTLLAEGIPDSVWVKTESGDSLKALRLTGLPEFEESGDVMRGEVMTYDFETRRGRVLRGRTKFEDGYYGGDALKMMSAKSLNVSGGVFTTCDRDSAPHFHFWSRQMKILVNDKVIARPVILFAGRIPVLALPFAMFPVKKGRHSGFLIPRYGESALEGRYLRRIGYYWAPSDYFDVTPTLDFFEKSGFLFGADLNYQVRYRLRGSVSGSWTRKDFEASGTKERRWDLSMQHRQQLSPTSELTVSGNLVSSGTFYRETSLNRERRLQNRIRSNATYTQRALFGSKWGLSVNLNQEKDLTNQGVSESLPQITLQHGQSALIPASKEGGRRSGTAWYNQIYWSYSSRGLFRRVKTANDEAGTSFTVKRGTGWDHKLQLSSTQKLLGWINWTPALRYNETWYDRRKSYDGVDSQNAPVLRTDGGFYARRIFSASATFGTKVYGVFYPRPFKSVSLRHVATPTVGVTYQPDFSGTEFGYMQSVEDTAGRITSYDRFDNSLLGFSSTPREGQKGLTYGLQNLFQMKVGEGEKVKKIDLFNADFSGSYNWKAKQYKFSDLSSTFRATPGRSLSLSLASRYTFYGNDASGAKEDRLLLDRVEWNDWRSVLGHRWLRNTWLSADATLRFAGKAGASGAGRDSSDAYPGGDPGFDRMGGPGGRFDDGLGDATDMRIPWNFSASLSYSQNRENPANPSRTFWIRSSVDFNLTRNWKVTYSNQMDLELKKAVSQDISLYRDLHCWEAQVQWTPTGYNKRLYFRINIKSPMLKELKLEKGTGSRGLYGY